MDKPLLWRDIDHAETCLVSAMYEEAAEVASSTLRILIKEAFDEVISSPLAQNEPSRKRDDWSEVVSMVEAAGMVLLQALNQMDRPCNIFDDLISIFDGVGKIPYSLILTGTCLQLSMGFHPASQIALEEYLSGWRSLEDSLDGLMAKVMPVRLEGDDSEGATRTVYLSRRNYFQLTEIYAIEVLAKLHRNSVGAHLWIQNSSIPEEDKKASVHDICQQFSLITEACRKLQKLAILGRLQQLVSDSQALSLSSSTKPRSEISPGVVSGEVPRTSKETVDAGSREQEVSTSLDSPQATRGEITPVSEEPLSRAVRGSGMWRYSFMRTVLGLVELVMIRLSFTSGSKWLAVRRKIPQSRVLLTGAFASMIVYATFRNRQFLRRRMMQMTNLARVCFSDLYRLAFSIHLNPLAAV